MECATKSLIY